MHELHNTSIYYTRIYKYVTAETRHGFWFGLQMEIHTQFIFNDSIEDRFISSFFYLA